MTTARTTVEVFGQRLALRTEGDSERLAELARWLDRRMREVADQTSSVDTVKIAILTALNIADELFRERDADQDARQRQYRKHAERLVLKLEEVLGPSQNRGEDNDQEVPARLVMSETIGEPTSS